MAGKDVVTVTDVNFDEEVIQSAVPVLVDFTAAWCGPCRQIAPFVDELATEYLGRAKVAKLDIDENPGMARKYNVRGVPTLYVFKGGEVFAQQVGAVPKVKLAALIDRAL